MSTNTKTAEALRKLLKRDQRNTCTHEETHRGGVIWEICDHCGAKWADDEGGKPEWKDPPEWVEAEQALAAHDAEQAQAAKCPHEGQCHPGFCPCSEVKAAPEAQAAGQEQDERAAFEAWFQGFRHGWKSEKDVAFDAWQARAALAQRQPLTRQQIDDIMTKHYPLDSMLSENVDAFEDCVRDIEAAHGIGGATTGEQHG